MSRVVTSIASTCMGKVLLGLLFLALLICLSLFTVGLLQGELLGYLAFTILPVAILINASIVIAQHVNSGSIIIAKIVWSAIACTVLFIIIYCFYRNPSNDIEIFLMYSMLFLSFPVSFLVAGLFTLLVLIQEQLGVPLLDIIASNYVGYSVMWLAFFVAGYTQWFVMLPWLWRKWKTRQARNAASST